MSDEQAVALASVAEVFELNHEQIHESAGRSLLTLTEHARATDAPEHVVTALCTLQAVVAAQGQIVADLFRHAVARP